jgi:hypothetical protein
LAELTYTLAELAELGCEGWHVADDGCFWLFHGCWALRFDEARGMRTLVMDRSSMPAGPWRLTDWGTRERVRRAEQLRP